MGIGLTPYCHWPRVKPVPGTGSVGAGKAEHRLEDGGVGHLLHEQGNVLEDVAVIKTEATAENVLALTGEIVGETNARAEVQIIVLRDFADVRIAEMGLLSATSS